MMFLPPVVWFVLGAIVGIFGVWSLAKSIIAPLEAQSVVQDKIFLNRIQFAMDKYYEQYRAIGREAFFDNGIISVIVVPHFVELRYGIHFKDTNEYAIFSNFSSFLSNDIGVNSYYRSNVDWQEITLLPASKT